MTRPKTDIRRYNPRELAAFVKNKQPLPEGYCKCRCCNQIRIERREGLCGPCDTRSEMSERVKIALLTPTQLPMSRKEEARHNRARQLADTMRAGPSRVDLLRREGWLENVIYDLVAESPEWFSRELSYVDLTLLGRQVLLGERKRKETT